MVGILITLDKVRHLRYSANDIADIEEVLDAGFRTLMSSDAKIGFRHARAFLWGGLKHEDRKLQAPGGLERVGGLIEQWYQDGGTLDTLYIKMITALKEDSKLASVSEEDREKIEKDMGEAIGLPDEAE